MRIIPKLNAPLALTFVLAGSLLAGYGFRAMGNPAATAPAPTHLAVVNIVKVFSGLNEKIEGDRQLEDLGKKISDEKAQKEDNLKKLSEGLQNPAFRPDSQDYKNQQDQVLQASMDLQVFLAVSQQRLLLMQRMKTESIYRSMNDAIKKYAERNGIAIVFVIDDADVSGAKDVQELNSHIAMRKIIYAHPSYDITKDIVEQMNSEFHPSDK